MKFKIVFIFFLVVSCTNINYNKHSKIPYNSKGFAYIYNENDLKDKKIRGRLDNSKLQVSSNKIGLNSLIKIINPKTKESITLKNKKTIKYPDFYKIVITRQVADKLNLDTELPLVEVLEIKKNKSFVAKKAKIFNEEKKISSKAPVASVKISNISKNKTKKKKIKNDKLYIVIATFYSEETAFFLKQRITKELSSYDTKKLIVRKKNTREIDLISGPYKAINSMKNDYIQLKKFGFEELDIIVNE